jgi:hypothetical protein
MELHFLTDTLFSRRFSIYPALDPDRLRVVRSPRGRGNLWNVFSLRAGQLTTDNQVSRLR